MHLGVVTDEWRASSKLSEEGRPHATVNHGRREWHGNTMEGLWTSLRHWLRPFRGVSKKCLQGDVAALGWGYNRKRVDKAELWKIVSRVVGKELFSDVGDERLTPSTSSNAGAARRGRGTGCGRASRAGLPR
jgi:hypothetical protein